ncbi:hypothetical protein JOQ06_021303, partial [Pogonophryne albipinna]
MMMCLSSLGLLYASQKDSSRNRSSAEMHLNERSPLLILVTAELPDFDYLQSDTPFQPAFTQCNNSKRNGMM